MTVAELIEELKALPQDLAVAVRDEYDYTRVISVGLVRIVAQRADFVRANGEPITIAALNFDPVDLLPSPHGR